MGKWGTKEDEKEQKKERKKVPLERDVYIYRERYNKTSKKRVTTALDAYKRSGQERHNHHRHTPHHDTTTNYCFATSLLVEQYIAKSHSSSAAR